MSWKPGEQWKAGDPILYLAGESGEVYVRGELCGSNPKVYATFMDIVEGRCDEFQVLKERNRYLERENARFLQQIEDLEQENDKLRDAHKPGTTGVSIEDETKACIASIVLAFFALFGFICWVSAK